MQEAKNRSSAEGGAAEAGQKAAAELSLHLSSLEAEEVLLDPGSASPAPSPRKTPPAARAS